MHSPVWYAAMADLGVELVNSYGEPRDAGEVLVETLAAIKRQAPPYRSLVAEIVLGREGARIVEHWDRAEALAEASP